MPPKSAEHRQRRNPVRRKGFGLWAHLDLNQGPHPYQGCALTELSYGPEGPRVYQRPRRGMPDAGGASRIIAARLGM